MRRDEQPFGDDHQRPRRGRSLDLFFWQEEGGRYYLRFTGLGALLILGLTLVSLVAIVVLYVFYSQQIDEPTNVKIRLPESPTTIGTPIIRQQTAPQKQPPRAVVNAGSGVNVNVPAVTTPTPAAGNNSR